MPVRLQRVCSSAWLERTPDKGEVGGSSPPRPTISINKFVKFKWILVYQIFFDGIQVKHL